MIWALLSPYTSRILAVMAIIAALSVIWEVPYHSGKKAAQTEAQAKQIKSVRKAHAIETHNLALPDGDAVKQLRRDWIR